MKQYSLLIFVIFMSVYITLGFGSRCVKSCRGLPDGKYQSCKGCGSFVVCCHGFLLTSSCRHGTYWDDFFKRCQKKSTTCPKPLSNPCITNCTGIPDGVYQSCKDCRQYDVCYHGETHVKTCSHGTFWDDSLKRCQKKSTTCPTEVPSRCISNCAGLPNGDYQSCLGCRVYASCVEGHIYNNRSCPANLVWDDFLKRCEYSSPTCPPGGSSPCMSNCTGKPSGNYQSCHGCDVFASCCLGNLIDDRDCPSGTVWDDALKRCEKTSRTCRGHIPKLWSLEKTDHTCITNCSGKPNGSYKSCIDCGVYVMCSNNVISIMPCPGNTVWDDSLKRCQDKSTTCPGPMNLSIYD